jgi:hypothetical protein
MLANQSKTFNLLQPPVPHEPLFLQPPGKPLLAVLQPLPVEHPLHPIFLVLSFLFNSAKSF